MPCIDSVFAELLHRMPVTIERLGVKHVADDNNLWFIKANTTVEVQIETHPEGRAPFLIEGGSPEQRRMTSEVSEAVDLIVRWLDVP